MKSKCWMVEKLAEIFPNAYLGTIAHYGGWYATVAKNIFQQFGVKKYYNIELDENCIEIADDFNYELIKQLAFQKRTARLWYNKIFRQRYI